MTGKRQRNDRLRSARVRRGWSQKEAAERAQHLAAQLPGHPELSIDDRYFSRWEAGAVPHAHHIALLCQLYNSSPADLALPTDHLPSLAQTVASRTTAILPPDELPYKPSEDPYLMLRRQFLHDLFATTAGAMLLPAALQPPSRSVLTGFDLDALLHDCQANIAACWRLLQGNDLVVVPSVLVSWLPVLDKLIREQSQHTNRLAALAAEGYMVAGVVSVLQGHNDRGEWHCRQAVDYATMTGNANIHVAALKHLAAKYNDAHYPLLTLSTYQRALPLLDQTSPLLKSRTHLGLALTNAQCGDQVSAMHHWELAQQLFPDQPHLDPAFSYADCRRSSLNHYGGLMQLAFGKPMEAWRVFEAATLEPIVLDVPERTVVEIIICQAEAATAAGDVELACMNLEAAVTGAIRLRSAQRFQDSLASFNHLRQSHPHENRVQRLDSLFSPQAQIS